MRLNNHERRTPGAVLFTKDDEATVTLHAATAPP
jgi:hypothetical protein